MTDRLDSLHGWVWRWCFANKGTPQVLHGWGSWDTRAEAKDALARHVQGLQSFVVKGFEVRRVPCNLRPLDNWLPPKRKRA